MPQPDAPAPRIVQFGHFELDLQSGALSGNGGPRRIIPDQPLLILQTLLERPGDLVTRDELRQRLWPGDTFVDFEHGLNAAIKRLRDVLGDSADTPRLIETIPRRGYRFIAPVNGVHDVPNAVPQGTGPTIAAERARGTLPREEAARRVDLRRPLAAAGSVLLLGFVAVWARPELEVPVVTNYSQITNDAQQKEGILVNDGSRLYFVERVNNVPVLVQASTGGGETVPVPIPFANPGLDDISPSGSELIVGSNVGAGPFPYWLVPLPGGSVRRLGDLSAHDVHPSPNGQQIAYAVNSDVYVSKRDGSAVRKLASVPHKAPGFIAWAPDGQRLRFTVFEHGVAQSSIWEMRTDGTGLRPLLPEWNNPAKECCGRWTSDGRYYIFQSTQNGISGLWAIREMGGLWRRAPKKPVRLTDGPLHFRTPSPSKDGRTIFAIGDQVRGEIMRRDPGSAEWVPLSFGGSTRSISELTYSRRGDWVAYSTYPERALWRSRLDDSDRYQLTFPPMEARWPSWSPDGERLLFQGRLPGKPWKLYVVSAKGGNPEQLLPGPEGEGFGDWSPDGKQIVFGGSPFFDPGTIGRTAMYLLELGTNRVSKIPGSEGLFAARWSPDGRYLLAHSFDFRKLMLLDLAAGRWEELASGMLHFANWSSDGRYIYFERWGHDVAATRIRLRDRREEAIGSLKAFRRTIGPERCWSGLTPDNSLLVLRDIGSQEIYALQWDPR